MSNGRGHGRLVKSWDKISQGAVALTTDSTNLISSLAFANVGTVMRMFGEYVIAPTSAPAATDSCSVTVGIGVVSTDAATLGSSAMPDPAVEAEFPWLFWRSHRFFYVGTDPEASTPNYGVRSSFDIRSMRKLRPRESLVLIAQYVDSVGAPPLTFSAAATRVLLGTGVG